VRRNAEMGGTREFTIRPTSMLPRFGLLEGKLEGKGYLGGTFAVMGIMSSHPSSKAGHASASHNFGFSPKSRLLDPTPPMPGPPVPGGAISTPAAIASSIRLLNRRLKKNDLSTMADETKSSTKSVARNVNKYNGVDWPLIPPPPPPPPPEVAVAELVKNGVLDVGDAVSVVLDMMVSEHHRSLLSVSCCASTALVGTSSARSIL